MELRMPEIEHVYGKTRSGMNFESRGKLLTVSAKLELFSTKSSAITLIAQEVDLQPENKCHAEHCRFSIVNFEFIGNHPAKRIMQDGTKQVEHLYLDLELRTPWGLIIVDPVPDYKDVIARIKAQKSISVTCELVAKPSEVTELHGVASKMDELCRLLSLARGTKITWITAEECMKDGKAHRIILRNAVTRPFSSLPLIDPRNPQDTALFIEKVYPSYLKLRDSYNLNIAIEQYLDAKRETVYLETRALTAVSLLDFLQGRYASPRGLDKIASFSDKEQKQIRLCLKRTMESLRPNIHGDKFKEVLGEDTLQEMMEKTSELDRRSYLNMLKLWAQDLKLDISEDELSEVKHTRNTLVHGAKFQLSDPINKTREYFRVIRLIDQVFLKLLGYDGYFIDVNLDTLQFERHMLNHAGSIEQQNV